MRRMAEIDPSKAEEIGRQLDAMHSEEEAREIARVAAPVFAAMMQDGYRETFSANAARDRREADAIIRSTYVARKLLAESRRQAAASVGERDDG